MLPNKKIWLLTVACLADFFDGIFQFDETIFVWSQTLKHKKVHLLIIIVEIDQNHIAQMVEQRNITRGPQVQSPSLPSQSSDC